jgi:CBS domain-containing protein
MKICDPVSLILNKKGGAVWSVAPETTVFAAIEMMAEKEVGALLVVDKGQPQGIVSERDYARKVVLKGRSSKDTPVSEIMTGPLVTVAPDCSVDEAMRLITTHRIRHLPVVENGKLQGLISIGDLVQWIAFAQDRAIENLSQYIEGKYPC